MEAERDESSIQEGDVDALGVPQIDATLKLIRAERIRQDNYLGWNRDYQDHIAGKPSSPDMANAARRSCKDAARIGRVTWRHILEEEFWETVSATNETDLEKELVQLAAVAAGWIEALRRRREGESQEKLVKLARAPWWKRWLIRWSWR